MPDLNTVTTAFATIVGLVCNYVSLPKDTPELPNMYSGFMAYLEKNHNEIRCIIDANSDISNYLERFLDQGLDDINQKLNKLDLILAGVAANLDDYKQLSVAIHPDSILSDEAVDLLKSFYNSGGARFLELKFLGGKTFMPLDSGDNSIDIEYRFLEDDLMTLCGLGFLRLDYNSKAERIFILTRQAEQYLKAVTQGDVDGSH